MEGLIDVRFISILADFLAQAYSKSAYWPAAWMSITTPSYLMVATMSKYKVSEIAAGVSHRGAGVASLDHNAVQPVTDLDHVVAGSDYQAAGSTECLPVAVLALNERDLVRTL